MIQAFKMAMKSISGNKFRAFLTMLGIIIGVMALVILVSLVSGATGHHLQPWQQSALRHRLR